MYFDILGQQLEIGDVVAAAASGYLTMGKIEKFAPKMIRIAKLIPDKRGWRSTKTFTAYPDQIVKVDQQVALMWIMKKDTNKE